eukprot:TRINITY_DN37315_c0_g1_i1.p1 TRINITY_DN37315_c0_g1~~TRINITY_DN37315_c0_g1_i1.p1  ORF type:complete len:139 (-),score=31.08 TRINITY_DN37315_c0_g1_i1:24-440(-)
MLIQNQNLKFTQKVTEEIKPRVARGKWIQRGDDPLEYANVPNEDDILEMVKATINMITQKISAGEEMTRKDIAEYVKFLQEIVEGESESYTGDEDEYKEPEEYGDDYMYGRREKTRYGKEYYGDYDKEDDYMSWKKRI